MEYFLGRTILVLLHEIQRKMAENRIRPGYFKDRVISIEVKAHAN